LLLRRFVPLAPRIGITCNLKENENTLNTAYVRAVVSTGAIPLLLPVCARQYFWHEMLGTLDGLVLSGGGDPDAYLYGEDASPAQGEVQPQRDAMELYLARRALQDGIPLLGICRGAQMMAVAAGGTLHQDLSGVEQVQHDQLAPRSYPIHRIKIRQGSVLYRVVGREQIRVNSLHHQAVKRPGTLTVSAVAPDGVTEAVEMPGHPFALGVQWHPEWLTSRHVHARLLFAALRDAARLYTKKGENI
jgi:putative glutamine amidotransferase